jgi:SAM-dependent methyltransferase
MDGLTRWDPPPTPPLTIVDTATIVERQRRLLAGATGRVLDLGGAQGSHLRHYRPDLVTSVVVAQGRPIDQPGLRRRARGARVPVELGADPVAFASTPSGERFDTIVAQFVLGSAADLTATLRVCDQLLAPEGRLLVLDAMPLRGIRLAVVEAGRPVATGWLRRHDAGRDVVARLRASGYTITDLQRFALPTVVMPLRRLFTASARRSARVLA